jgi:plastocyanin
MEIYMKTLRATMLLTVLVLSLAACGRAATPQPVSMTIEMSEYKFDPSSLEFKVGQQVTLELVNNGQLQHEVMFGRDEMKVDNRPVGYQVDMFDAGGVTPQVNITEEAR